MRTATQTRIFGIKVGVDPKILVGALVAGAALLFWYNSRSDVETSAPVAAPVRTDFTTPIPAAPLRPRTTAASRRSVPANNRGTLRLRPVDATRGDVDPTLRLDLLARLQGLQRVASGRSLFDVGAATVGMPGVPVHPPVIVPRSMPVSLPTMGAGRGSIVTSVPIPLKYYGFLKPAEGSSNRGFFLDGDNVLVATEGEVLKQQYLVVALNATGARMEDTRLKQGQTLPVEPVALQ